MKFVATPAQITAARGLLRLSQSELAKLADVARSTLARVEAGHESANSATLKSIQTALEDQGILFLTEEGTLGDGVRFAMNADIRRRLQASAVDGD